MHRSLQQHKTTGGADMDTGPLFKFRAFVDAGLLQDDTAQRFAAEKLQLLHIRLGDYNPAKPKKVGFGLFGWGRETIRERPIEGIYMYGGVGRGKSILMDMFFDECRITQKRRVHFHAFMQEVHDGIASARAAFVQDPVQPVADSIADSATLLCFDEVQITDITDAMLVGRLFEKLFARGVVIVATSNRHPDDLYKDGLNRGLFLPFIKMIEERLEICHLEGKNDYRRDRIRALHVYHTPLGPTAQREMDHVWDVLAGESGEPLVLTVKGRTVVLPAFHNCVARASFADLCAQPLGAADYLAIAAEVTVLLLDDIPVLSPANNNEAKRFVILIDTLYEARVRLVCSAAVEPANLYDKGFGAFEFERTASRLEEMRSEGW